MCRYVHLFHTRQDITVILRVQIRFSKLFSMSRETAFRGAIPLTNQVGATKFTVCVSVKKVMVSVRVIEIRVGGHVHHPEKCHFSFTLIMPMLAFQLALRYHNSAGMIFCNFIAGTSLTHLPGKKQFLFPFSKGYVTVEVSDFSIGMIMRWIWIPLPVALLNHHV